MSAEAFFSSVENAFESLGDFFFDKSAPSAVKKGMTGESIEGDNTDDYDDYENELDENDFPLQDIAVIRAPSTKRKGDGLKHRNRPRSRSHERKVLKSIGDGGRTKPTSKGCVATAKHGATSKPSKKPFRLASHNATRGRSLDTKRRNTSSTRSTSRGRSQSTRSKSRGRGQSWSRVPVAKRTSSAKGLSRGRSVPRPRGRSFSNGRSRNRSVQSRQTLRDRTLSHSRSQARKQPKAKRYAPQTKATMSSLTNSSTLSTSVDRAKQRRSSGDGPSELPLKKWLFSRAKGTSTHDQANTTTLTSSAAAPTLNDSSGSDPSTQYLTSLEEFREAFHRSTVRLSSTESPYPMEIMASGDGPDAPISGMTLPNGMVLEPSVPRAPRPRSIFAKFLSKSTKQEAEGNKTVGSSGKCPEIDQCVEFAVSQLTASESTIPPPPPALANDLSSSSVGPASLQGGLSQNSRNSLKLALRRKAWVARLEEMESLDDEDSHGGLLDRYNIRDDKYSVVDSEEIMPTPPGPDVRGWNWNWQNMEQILSDAPCQV
jgi:hypothetical protein